MIQDTKYPSQTGKIVLPAPAIENPQWDLKITEMPI